MTLLSVLSRPCVSDQGSGITAPRMLLSSRMQDEQRGGYSDSCTFPGLPIAFW